MPRRFSTWVLARFGLLFFAGLLAWSENLPAGHQTASPQWIWQNTDGPNNTWLALRKRVRLSVKPTRAPTLIAVEGKYWLHVNGKLVVPDGGLDLHPDLDNTYCDHVDISPYLRAGENIIALLAWYKGGANGYSQRMVKKGGVFFDAALFGPEPGRIISDGTWKTLVHPSFACNPQQRQWDDYKWVEYPIGFDARSDPGPWTSLAFNDRSWVSATPKGVSGTAPWHSLLDRTIPMLKVSGFTPYTNQSKLPASFSCDTTFTAEVGNNIQGNAYLRVDAPAGVTVSIRMNEFYTEQYITKSGIQEYTTFQWQNPSGRPWSKHCVEYAFTGVNGNIRILDLKFRPIGYDTAFVGSFLCSDSRLNLLWDKCRNTSYVCMRDQFYDCPDRERGQWWGDVSEQILYSFYLFDSRASLLAKKAFRELFNTQKSDGSLYTTAPATPFHLPDQNLAAAISLGDYVLYSGDTDLAKELYPKLSIYIRRYLAATLNRDGMPVLQEGPWNWIDWGNTLDVKTGSANTVVCGLFVRLMETAKFLAQTSDNSQDVGYYQGLEDSVRSHFNSYFWNRASNAYVFHRLGDTQSTTIDDRSNAWAVLAGMPDGTQQGGVMRVLNSQQNASPYQERYIEDAMFTLGKGADALNRMLTYYQPDLDSWSQTMWERMGSNSTNNHAWAASPCYLLGAYVAGIKPTTPGFASYQVMPMLGNLTSVSASVPSPRGTITVRHTRSGGALAMILDSPSGTQAVVGIPQTGKWESITANGKVVWKQGAFVNGVVGIREEGADSMFIKFKVISGHWLFKAQ